MGLLTKKNKKSIEKITKVNYTFLSTNKKYCWNKFNPPENTLLKPNGINISIDPHMFNRKSVDVLEHVNDKWFLNLSGSTIPHEVSTLLQLGERFCLPTYLNKKLAIHEFVKDIESNLVFHNSKKQVLIRNIAIPQFHTFIKNTPPKHLFDLKLIH